MIAGHPVEVVDTTGAGDCLCGALTGELSRGATMIEAATLANTAAAISIQRLDAGPSMPTRQQVEAFAG